MFVNDCVRCETGRVMIFVFPTSSGPPWLVATIPPPGPGLLLAGPAGEEKGWVRSDYGEGETAVLSGSQDGRELPPARGGARAG